MGIDLLISVLGGLIVTVLVGSAIYKYVLKKNNKNRGIIQEKGNNQVALQKSKNNSINIGVGTVDNEKGNKSD